MTTATAPQTIWTLKVNLDAEIRRLKGCQTDLPAVREAVAGLYSLSSAEAQKLALQYEDDEGDLCTLTETTLPDAVAIAERLKHTLRIHCSRDGSLVRAAQKSSAPQAGAARAPMDEAEERQAHRMDEHHHGPDRQATELDARQRQRLDGMLWME
eukprot:CAMPEP_0204602590 /NCGR_PEP_ID=MMETSP0661-20131031/56742_1 /ASSEMBLY_ACC=CAM_ASM_000606 /TAXON_ID=109239 /ORGANISM="Alexandrium margalefi, Strain AMGDE01CS-322" /LENGTH=154 /DNA_ID=CAMNT_0051613563 /DNA_START=75 /DNA_END=540 /DNA_ORIENTATION=-